MGKSKKRIDNPSTLFIEELGRLHRKLNPAESRSLVVKAKEKLKTEVETQAVRGLQAGMKPVQSLAESISEKLLPLMSLITQRDARLVIALVRELSNGCETTIDIAATRLEAINPMAYNFVQRKFHSAYMSLPQSIRQNKIHPGSEGFLFFKNKLIGQPVGMDYYSDAKIDAIMALTDSRD